MSDRRDDRSRIDMLKSATDDLQPTDALTDAIMARVATTSPVQTLASDEDAELVKLTRATDHIEPVDAMSDAIMVAILAEKSSSAVTHDMEAIFARASEATADISPSDGFVDAVMEALPSPTSSARPVSIASPSKKWTWTDAVSRSGRGALFLAAAVAAACVLFSTYTEHRLDSEVVSSVDPVEVGE